MDIVTTNWRQLSDEPQKHADVHSMRSGRVLIVDDDIESSSSLELMLRASGYSETRVAYSGHAALAIAAEFQPSMVLLELGLLAAVGEMVAVLESSNVEAARAALRSLIGTILVFEDAGKLYGRLGVDPIPLYRRNATTFGGMVAGA